MIIGIDASNINAGGGLIHLLGILKKFRMENHAIEKIIIWSSEKTISQIPSANYLIKESHALLNSTIIHRYFWLRNHLPKIFKSHQCDILFNPGGGYTGDVSPYVTMSQNMLIFEQEERARYGISMTRLRLKILSLMHPKSIRKAAGTIFISNYALGYISRRIEMKGLREVISHGIDSRFCLNPKKQKSIHDYSRAHPFELVYVSIIDVYKHQGNLVKAIEALAVKYPVKLTLIGPAYPPALKKLEKVISKIENVWAIDYLGKVSHEEIQKKYQEADGFIFASTCENLPNIVIEAMSSGLPIISSYFGPMPEVLKEGALYFNPLEVESVHDRIVDYLEHPEKREVIANIAYEDAQRYSWAKCSDETFMFIRKVYDQFKPITS